MFHVEATMALAEIQPRDILEDCRRTLGLPPGTDMRVDDELIAGLVRHSAGFLCPCSAATLRSAVADSLRYLVEDEDILERIEDSIERLVTGGDLLELHQVTIGYPAVRGTWLFAAPPSHVVRPSGSIFLIGIVPDRDTYLPQALASRICYEGTSRVIIPDSEEDLSGELADLGLRRLSQENWLKFPKPQTADDLRSLMETKLHSQSRSGAIADLQILDSSEPVSYYRGRWTAPKKKSGVFIARRPRQYGSPLWCFIQLENGEASKLLDLPLSKSRWRGCDAAWHLQMAIDYSQETPQLYRLRVGDQSGYLDFFSPLPLWAQRRLMIVGRPSTPEKCLLSYWVPQDELEEEERFLQERLWLVRQSSENGG